MQNKGRTHLGRTGCATGRSSHGRQRGAALLASLVIVLLIAGFGAVMVQISSASLSRQTASADLKRALFTAEAGLTEAYMAVALGKTGNVASPEVPAAFGGGVYWVEAEDLLDDQVRLKSTGACGVGRISLSLVLARHVNPIGSLGVFGDEGVTIQGGVELDGYDSGDDDFDVVADPTTGIAPGDEGLLCSNGDISFETSFGGGFESPPVIGGPGEVVTVDGQSASPGTTSPFAVAAGEIRGGGGDDDDDGGGVDLRTAPETGPSPSPGPGPKEAPSESSTTIHGDVRTGPSGSILWDSDVTVTGSTQPSKSKSELPTIDPPSIASQGDFLLEGAQTQSISAGEAAYDTFRIGDGSTVVLSGPLTFLADEMWLDAGATLSFDTTGGAVVVYCADYLNFAEGSTIDGSSADAQSVAFLVAASESTDRDGDGFDDPPIAIRSNGDFRGMFYAPNAEVSVPASLRLFGAVSGQHVVLEEGARITFDIAMAKSTTVFGGLPRVVSWRVDELPDEELCKIRVDPLKLLQKWGVTPMASCDAHAEDEMILSYIDSLGNPATYVGTEDALDWNDVAVITELGWVGSPHKAGSIDTYSSLDQAADAAAPTSLIGDVLGDLGLTSREVRDILLAESPLTNAELIAALQRTPPLDSQHLSQVMNSQSQVIEEPVLHEVLNVGGTVLDDRHVSSILNENSPLPASIVSRIAAGDDGGMTDVQRSGVLNNQ